MSFKNYMVHVYHSLGHPHHHETRRDGSIIDPFGHHDSYHQASLRIAQERDVSLALKRLGRGAENSQAAFVTPEASPSEKGVTKQLEPKLKSQSHSSAPVCIQPPDGSYKSVEAVPKGTRELKLILEDKPQLEKEDTSRRDGVRRSNKHEWRTSRHLSKLPRDSSGGEDWVTEEVSEADSNLPGPFGTRGVFKTTGSSIADFSDDDEGKLPSQPRSRHRIFARNQSESYELQDLEGAKQHPLPKTRGNRGVAGSSEHANAFFSSGAKDNSADDQARPALPRMWSNPFVRNNSYRRADSSGNFVLKIGRNKPTRYEFRDSESDYSLDIRRHLATLSHQSVGGSRPKSNVKQRGDASRESSGDLRDIMSRSDTGSMDGQPAACNSSSEHEQVAHQEQHDGRLVDEAYPIQYNNWRHRSADGELRMASGSTESSFNRELIPSKPKFEFELLPLDEAQRKHKPKSQELRRSRRILFPLTPHNCGLTSSQIDLRQLPESASRRSIIEAIESSVSESSRRRRKYWFYTMLILSLLLPFFAIPVLVGTFNESLVWFTGGEVRQLTMRQRHIIKYVFLAEFFIYSVVVVCVIGYFANRH
ncbi:hypothetical protein GGS23DRAFT_615844 [Durotheca rogersii]|uniref:uncharacterized protein n=1 Tax=Durotheca rogersii TaxID=419775 RepID=UPI0022200D48|nr:uncharacterized protein GGS23DRAFT_615844 [Durotheca rogersii]KAI5859650.1 hypothetical protein GGS23DRAFT_615844 [Durotheca rogersii]